jgi:hypothetical protein
MHSRYRRHLAELIAGTRLRGVPERTADLRDRLVAIALEALDRADERMSAELGEAAPEDTPARSPSVRELEEWCGG